MPLVELLLASIPDPRDRIVVLLRGAGVLLGILAVACFLHAMTAVQTHIGLPSLTTLALNAVWPALAALVLILMHRYLPRLLLQIGQCLAVGQRQYAWCMCALGLVGASTLWAWLHPTDKRAQALPSAMLMLAIIPLGAVMALRDSEAVAQRRPTDVMPEEDDALLVPAWARSLANVIVVSSALTMTLVVWGLMSRLPVGAGGLREKCVQIDVSTVGMPAPARRALVGAAAAKRKSPGREMTMPTRILRRDGREAFLWMGTGQGVTVPLDRIGVILDYDEGTSGCTGDAAQPSAGQAALGR